MFVVVIPLSLIMNFWTSLTIQKFLEGLNSGFDSQKNGGVLGHFPVPLRHIRDIRNANWSPQNAQQNWLRRLEVDLVGASFQRWYANTDSTVTPEEILVERCERQLRVFNSCLSRLDNLPPEISSVMREYIQSGMVEPLNEKQSLSVFCLSSVCEFKHDSCP